MIKSILWVGLGGSIGSILRYCCQKWFAENIQHSFPWATFLVNLTGCFLIGVIYATGEKTSLLTPQARLLLATGFCGGFTTFSTFAFENMNLLRSGDISYFFLYTLGSVFLGITGVFAGSALIKSF